MPGLAKTRLAATLGARCAADLARAFLLDSWRALCALPWARPVLAASEQADELQRLTGAATTWHQGPGSFNQRMERVLRRALTLAPRALVIGSDSPGLPPRLLEQAHTALLDGVEAVIGPAADGGFYLLGLSRCPAGLLAGLRWGDGQTCARTSARLGQAGLALASIAPWFDVDLPVDLLQLERCLQEERISAPETARQLGRTELRLALERLRAGTSLPRWDTSTRAAGGLRQS